LAQGLSSAHGCMRSARSAQHVGKGVSALHPTVCAWSQVGGAEGRSALEQAAGAGRFRDAFLSCLQERRPSLAAAAARALTGLLLNRAVDADLLDGAGSPHAAHPTFIRTSIHSLIRFEVGPALAGMSTWRGVARRCIVLGKRSPLDVFTGCRQRKRPCYAITCLSGPDTMYRPPHTSGGRDEARSLPACARLHVAISLAPPRPHRPAAAPPEEEPGADGGADGAGQPDVAGRARPRAGLRAGRPRQPVC